MPKKKNQATKTTKNSAAATSRLKRFKSLRLSKSEPAPKPTTKLTGSFRLFMDSFSLLRQHWKLFGGIIAVYLILSIVLVGALAGNYDISTLKRTFGQQAGQLTASVALFGVLLGSAGSPSTESGAAYQSMVVVLVSLATIWSLRQILAGKKIGLRDAFYEGMYPLVPFVFVLFVLVLEVIPAAMGGFLYNAMLGNGLAVTGIEKLFWVFVMTLLMLLSLYLISTSLFAAYIVTLPDMRPVAALKAARRLARYRRWSIVRKLLFLPFALICISALIILPLIIFVPVAVQWVFLLLSLIGLVFAHIYVYNLYRELL